MSSNDLYDLEILQNFFSNIMPYSTNQRTPTVLVTGANGYLGSAVIRAFVSAGWTTYGLVRRASSFPALYKEEVIPVQWSMLDPLGVLSALPNRIDVIASCSEQHPDYQTLHEANMKLFSALGERSEREGTRTLVLFTSGCKDYGITGLHGEPGLVPHTEESLVNPPLFAMERAKASEEVLGVKSFDAVSLRPTPLFGREGSFNKVMFDLMDNAVQAEKTGSGSGLYVGVDKRTVFHGCHVDDAASAYVMIAESKRAVVKGKVYNISGRRYETLEDVMKAMAKEYGLQGGIRWAEGGNDQSWELAALLGYSQWVYSEKIRSELGWSDSKKLLSENAGVYRRSYEEAMERSNESLRKIDVLTKLAWERKN